MGFFYNTSTSTPTPAKRSPQPPKNIPIHALNQMGCRVCPRNGEEAELTNPKRSSHIAKRSEVFVLLPTPSMHDDNLGTWGGAGELRVVLRQLEKELDCELSVGGVLQCASPRYSDHERVSAPSEIECCRLRVTADIEKARPRLVIGIGDTALTWATGLTKGAPTVRGRFMSIRVGNHVCWFICINHPFWAMGSGNSREASAQELVFQHDKRTIASFFKDPAYTGEPPNYATGYGDNIVSVLGHRGALDFKELEKHLGRVSSYARVGFDLETNGLRPWRLLDPKILTVSVGSFEDTVAFPLYHQDGWPDKYWADKASRLLAEWMTSSGIKECHNLAFEFEWLSYFWGCDLLRVTEWDDTMSMAHTIDPRQGTKSLSAQTIINFGFDVKALSTLDTARLDSYPVKDVLKYNGMDSRWTNRLSRVLRQQLAADPALQYAHDRKVRLASTLVMTEYRGLPIDIDYAVGMEAQFDATLSEIQWEIQQTKEVQAYTRKFGPFSPTNPDHVLTMLDRMLHRPEVVITDRNGTRKSTAEEVLSSIPVSEVPSAALVLEHRGLEKLQSTYLRPLTTRRSVGADGLMRCKYSSMVAETHRLSAEDPNAQNWPKRKHREVRGVVAAREKRWLLAADYGQIEFRVAGMCSMDQELLRYCWREDSDVHKDWAQRIHKRYPAIKDWVVSTLGVDWDEKGMKMLRQEAKNKWVFPSIFGAQVQSRAASLGLPVDIATELDRDFWGQFPGVKKWQQGLMKFYEKHLYVQTLGGLRRYGPMSLNEIINMPIQGTAAEIVTEAMMALSELALVRDRMEDLHPALNVHDDLTFEPFDDNLEDTVQVIAREMCKPRFDYINVPLVVEMSLGKRWSELQEFGVYRSNVLFDLKNPFDGSKK